MEELTGREAGLQPARAARAETSPATPSRKTRPIPKVAAMDRRATIRYPSHSEGVCLPVGGGADVRWSAQVKDVSDGGINLLVNRRFEPGSVLMLDFKGQHPDRPVCLLVRVVHVQALSKRKWSLGCRFGRRIGEEEVKSLVQ